MRLALLCDSASEKVKVALALPDPKTDLSSDEYRTLCVLVCTYILTELISTVYRESLYIFGMKWR